MIVWLLTTLAVFALVPLLLFVYLADRLMENGDD